MKKVLISTESGKIIESIFQFFGFVSILDDYKKSKKMNNTIREILKQRILILDGAMGTMLQEYQLTEEDFRGHRFRDWKCPLKGNNDLLTITQPHILQEIHQKYLEAGADILETNTFSGTTIAMKDYNMEALVYELNYESASIAKKTAVAMTEKNPNKPRFVAGSIGPTNKTASMSPEVNNPEYRAISFDQLKTAYKQQSEALLDGGVDILLVETIFDTLNAKAALFAIDQIREERQIDIPVMISATITDASGRTLSGQTLEAFLISISHLPLLSVGLNCSFGADLLRPYLKQLKSKTNLYTSVHPNAGLPNAFGEYDQSPEEMKNLIVPFFEEKLVNIIGGCCGTNPKHIQKIYDLSKKYKPRSQSKS